MVSRTARWTAALITVAGLCVACPARAQQDDAAPTAAQRETARGLMQAGDEHFAAGDYPAATKSYAAADRIMGVPTTALALARSQAAMGLLVEAADALARARRYPARPNEPGAFVEAREQAKRLDAELAKRIPRLVPGIEGAPSDLALTLFVDGSPVVAEAARAPQRVNPGSHVLRVEAPGYLPVEAKVSVTEGERRGVRLRLVVDPAAPSEEQRGEAARPDSSEDVPAESRVAAERTHSLSALSYTALSAGVTNLALGVAFGVVVLQRTSRLEAACGGTACSEAERDEHRSIERMANVSNAAWALTAVGLGVAAVSIGLDLSGGDERVEAALGPGAAALRLRF